MYNIILECKIIVNNVRIIKTISSAFDIDEIEIGGGMNNETEVYDCKKIA